MARRRASAAISAGDVLPRHLVDQSWAGQGAGAYSAVWRERSAWFKAHGIDVRDWSTVSAVLRASEAAHGVALGGALERARLRALVAKGEANR
ncbi:hypothetical protein ENKNEFLB_01947 [Nocardioides aquaticus]|uniref:Uncharacterized protein n=1 Tax=Nocardioides aquaticus TaxID=160826 RepID=A0ABX8EH22_9ACTN|nr:hypothetical protein ENKNEFLB_01947 [Nocardioides aquaticus]